jgi:hypothetical protein
LMKSFETGMFTLISTNVNVFVHKSAKNVRMNWVALCCTGSWVWVPLCFGLFYMSKWVTVRICTISMWLKFFKSFCCKCFLNRTYICKKNVLFQIIHEILILWRVLDCQTSYGGVKT